MRRRVILGGVFLLGAATMIVTPRLLSRSEFFQVRRVEIRGPRYLTPGDVVTALDLTSEANLFDGTEGMADRVGLVPGVADAKVARRWPGTLVVTVVEQEPVALASQREGLLLMDGRGRILPFDPTRDPRLLPLAEADSGGEVALVLSRVKEIEPDVFTLIERASLATGVGGGVALYSGNRRYLVRSDPAARAIQDLAAVIRDLRQRGQTYRELDARFASRIFVRERWS